MTVQVEKKGNFVFFVDLSHQTLDSFNLRKILEIFIVKIAVKILTKDTSTMIADEDTVRIDHRNDEKDIVICQLRNLQHFRDEIL